MVSHYPIKFGGHGHCGCGDVFGLPGVFSLNLQDHMTRGSGNFMGTSPLRQATILPSLLLIGTAIVEI